MVMSGLPGRGDCSRVGRWASVPGSTSDNLLPAEGACTLTWLYAQIPSDLTPGCSLPGIRPSISVAFILFWKVSAAKDDLEL